MQLLAQIDCALAALTQSGDDNPNFRPVHSRHNHRILFGGLGMILGRTVKAGLVTGAASLALSCGLAAPAKAQSIQQQVINNVIQNILQDIRDQIQGRRLLVPGSGRALRFSGEDADEFDANNPVTKSNPNNPFAALAYTKTGPVYTKAPPVAVGPTYLYGLNLVGSGDESRALGITTSSASATGAFDVTRIGVFTASDAITFVATGSGVWSHAIGLDTTTSSGAGTLAYTNGGFSTDFTANASWTRESLATLGIVAPPNTSAISYTWNGQYKFDFANAWFIEPTVGVTYTDMYFGDFGPHMGSSTQVDAGARIGTEWMWNTVKVQPSLTGVAYTIADESGPVSGNKGQLGGRGSGKLNFIWTDHFSSYVEAHASGIAFTSAYGGSGGLRWTW
jgi:hypothetical protein